MGTLLGLDRKNKSQFILQPMRSNSCPRKRYKTGGYFHDRYHLLYSTRFHYHLDIGEAILYSSYSPLFSGLLVLRKMQGRLWLMKVPN